MTVPKIAMKTAWRPAQGDLLTLFWLDENTPAFPASLLPAAIQKNAAPAKEAGATRTLRHAEDALVRAVRLDAKHAQPVFALRKAVAKAIADARGEECRRVIVPLDMRREDLLAAAQEGALLGGYAFDKYLSEKKKLPEVQIVTTKAVPAALRKRLTAERVVCESANFARDVLNEPPNVVKPDSLAKIFVREGGEAGLKVSVWDEARLKKERCGGIVAVGQGAKAKPRLVIGEYAPPHAKKTLALVGKGVTFDAGGYCLKPGSSQVGMKYDMGGAAMMFGAACAVARLKLPVRVVVVTPLVENLISGEAYLNTTVITTRAGRTVEVHNTDAEGRLILTDALTLAAERKPDWIVDAATLTGACCVALGEDVAGVFGTDAEFTRALIDAGAEVGEVFWEMPLHQPYAESLKTTIADCKNIGGREGGAITAALFLQKWAPEGVKWVHCDVAGPAGKEEPLDHLGKGAKGFGVKTVVRLAERLAQ